MAAARSWPVQTADDSVLRDAEFDRIAALPRRAAPPVDVPRLDAYLKVPGAKLSLRQKQAELLYDLYLCRGAVGALPTGKGKTIPTVVAGSLPHPQDASRPWVERPLLVVPGGLLTKTAGEDYDVFDRPNAIGGDWGRYRRSFRTHPNQKVVSYQLLQHPSHTRLLWKLMPDLLVFDEAQKLRNRRSACALRVDAYLKDYPNTIVMVLSASLFKRKLADAAHLYWWALKERSPLPRPGSSTLVDWGKCVDKYDGKTTPIGPGALRAFCNPGEPTISGVRRRMVESPGVVADFESSCDASLNIFAVSPSVVPPEVVRAFALMRAHDTTPSGDELTDRFNVWRRTREIAYGFYYRWVWPNGIPDSEWLFARGEWRRFVRYVLRHNRRGVDTERRVRDAVDAGLYGQPGQGPLDGNGADGALKLAAWRKVRLRWDPHPPRETVWLSDYVVRACADWLKDRSSGKGRLCWVEHDALGRAIAATAGVPFFGQGDDGVERYRDPCVLGIRSNSQGRNLQDRYSENFFACAPDGGDLWEQAISRTHRDGQEEDEVVVWTLLHCKELCESFDNARADCLHQEALTGQEQKLNIATISEMSPTKKLALMNGRDPLWSEAEKEKRKH